MTRCSSRHKQSPLLSTLFDNVRLVVDLHVGLEATLNVVRNEVKYKAEIVRDYGELPMVECMPSQINQVLMNLLVNAAQAISEYGTITIRTRCGHDVVSIASFSHLRFSLDEIQNILTRLLSWQGVSGHIINS